MRTEATPFPKSPVAEKSLFLQRRIFLLPVRHYSGGAKNLCPKTPSGKSDWRRNNIMGKEEQRQRLWQGSLKARQGEEEEQCNRRQQGETPTGTWRNSMGESIKTQPRHYGNLNRHGKDGEQPRWEAAGLLYRKEYSRNNPTGQGIKNYPHSHNRKEKTRKLLLITTISKKAWARKNWRVLDLRNWQPRRRAWNSVEQNGRKWKKKTVPRVALTHSLSNPYDSSLKVVNFIKTF